MKITLVPMSTKLTTCPSHSATAAGLCSAILPRLLENKSRGKENTAYMQNFEVFFAIVNATPRVASPSRSRLCCHRSGFYRAPHLPNKKRLSEVYVYISLPELIYDFTPRLDHVETPLTSSDALRRRASLTASQASTEGRRSQDIIPVRKKRPYTNEQATQ